MPFAPVGTPAPPSRALPRMAIALLACLALYGIDLACMATVPATGFSAVCVWECWRWSAVASAAPCSP